MRWLGSRPGLLALLLIVLVNGGLWQLQKVQALRVFDQPFYLGIADDLVHSGRFTDGFMFAEPGPDGLRSSGMRFAPLYPVLVAGSSLVDGGLRRGMDCLVASGGRDESCRAAAPVLRGLQFGELAGVFWLVWWMGRRLGGAAVGWGSLVLAFGAAPLLLRSVAYLMTEMTCLALCVAAIGAGVRAIDGMGRERLGWACGAGALAGLAALTKPGFLYLLPAVVLAVLVLARRRGIWPAASFAVGEVAVLAPWVARNAMVMGRAALTYGYDSHTLVQRIAFDTMSWSEYGRAYLCWLPDGRSLGERLVGHGACDRFGWDEQPTSFYVLGLRHMLPETLAAAGGYEHHLSYLLHTYIFRMPVKHLLVSIPMALRAAYVAHWWGFVLFVPALIWTVAAGRQVWYGARGGWDGRVALLVLLPPWFMLAFNAAVAVNQVRYNLLLVPGYALAGALSLRWLVMRFGSGRWFAS